MTDHSQSPAVQITDLPFTGKFNLRCRVDAVSALEKALNVTLPVKIGDIWQGGSRHVLCLGPDEWMILCEDADRATLVADSESVYDKQPHSLVDVSFREVALEIAGPEAETLLNTSCPRNLNDIAPGRGTRTVFDTAQVVLIRQATDTFQMFVWRSFYPHVRGLMRAAEKELAAGL